MAAFVDHRFDHGFYLDEERLRKIYAIIWSRVKDIPKVSRLVFKVYRSDSFTYMTQNIEDVLSEENGSWSKLSRISLVAGAGEDLHFFLDFNDDKTYLHIEGQDRDAVFLLFSELREYLSHEVNVYRFSPDAFVYYLILGIWAIIGMTLVVSASGIVGNFSHTITKTEALDSQDLAIKLNYLIEQKLDFERDYLTRPLLSRLEFVLGLVLFSASPMLILSVWSRRKIHIFFPRSVFLFGKEIEREEWRKRWKERIVWGIGVSFVIGLLSSLVVWYMTSQ